LIAVADGAGSAKHADLGSALACDTAIEHLKNGVSASFALFGTGDDSNVGAPDLENAIRVARDALEVKAKELEVELRELGTTLLLAMARDGVICTAQVGDPMLFGQLPDGTFTALTVPERGEYVNSTTMLTSANALEKVQSFTYFMPFLSLVAISDGLLNVTTMLPYYQPYAPFLQHITGAARSNKSRPEFRESLISFLQSERIQDACEDDLTIVLATC